MDPIDPDSQTDFQFDVAPCLFVELPGDHWAVWGHFGGFGLFFNEFSKGSVETFWRTLTVFTGF